MNPVPNPVHMVDGKISTSQINISPETIEHAFMLFDSSTALTPSFTAFANNGGGKRQSVECSVRDDITRDLYMNLDGQVLMILEEWGSEYYGGVAREQFMIYNTGTEGELHLDDQHNVPAHLGVNKYLMHLLNQVAALTYIVSDDFEGGELTFPNQNVSVAPKTGTVVCFPSNYLFPHKVMPITRGRRIAIGRHYYIKDASRA